jgi:hypothetical protein
MALRQSFARVGSACLHVAYKNEPQKWFSIDQFLPSRMMHCFEPFGFSATSCIGCQQWVYMCVRVVPLNSFGPGVPCTPTSSGNNMWDVCPKLFSYCAAQAARLCCHVAGERRAHGVEGGQNAAGQLGAMMVLVLG